MKLLLEEKCSFSGGLGESCKLKYILFSQKESIGDVYGFVVQKTLGNEIVEQEEASHITDDLKIAKYIYSKILEGAITPISLNYVVDDLMYEFD